MIEAAAMERLKESPFFTVRWGMFIGTLEMPSMRRKSGATLRERTASLMARRVAWRMLMLSMRA